jgi:hypothetical protein
MKEGKMDDMYEVHRDNRERVEADHRKMKGARLNLLSCPIELPSLLLKLADEKS